MRALVVLALCLASPVARARETSAGAVLPPGWTETVVQHPAPVVESVGARLGVPLGSLTVRKLQLRGLRADVNIVRPKTASDADRLLAKLVGLRGPAFVRRRGDEVVEVAKTSNVLWAARVLHAMGADPTTPVTYHVKATLGLVESKGHDYMEANPVFQRFVALDAGRDDEAASFIRDATKDWTMGFRLSLFAGPRLGQQGTFSFVPQSASATQGRFVTTWTFARPNQRLGIHCVDVEGKVVAQSRFDPQPVEGDPGTTASTAWWPADDPKVQELVRGLAKGATTDEARVRAVLRYVWGSLRYAGQTGSRYGVQKVIAQGFGHCWDKSDVFITLCRAAGIPARQWAGWVPAMKSGHVWAAVRLKGRGWIPVDPTTPWLGTSHHYVPLFVSDDGHMPIVHLRWPKVEPR